VTGVHVGYIDTDMVKHVTEPKNDPAHVARMALDGLESGAAEVLVDEITRETKLKLADSPLVMYPQLTD
jgi:hypothetical protein